MPIPRKVGFRSKVSCFEGEAYGPHIIYVLLSCNHQRIPESEIKVLDISEGIQGEDNVKFICPRCGQEHTSVRLG